MSDSHTDDTTAPPDAHAHRPAPLGGRCKLVIAVHPNDKVLIAGAQLFPCRTRTIVHVTDDVPSDAVARAQGFRMRPEDPVARQRKLAAALKAGAIEARRNCPGYRDTYSCLLVLAPAYTGRLSVFPANFNGSNATLLLQSRRLARRRAPKREPFRDVRAGAAVLSTASGFERYNPSDPGTHSAAARPLSTPILPELSNFYCHPGRARGFLS